MVRTAKLATCAALMVLASGLQAGAGPVQRFYPSRSSSASCSCRSDVSQAVRPAPVLRIPWFGRTLTVPSPSVSGHHGSVNRFNRRSRN